VSAAWGWRDSSTTTITIRRKGCVEDAKIATYQVSRGYVPIQNKVSAAIVTLMKAFARQIIV
jgi:hypothetical protein